MAFDIAIVGGGLHGCVVALAVLHRRPAARICLIEQAEMLGGTHTWALHSLDVPVEAQPWFAPLVVQRWPGFDLQFPDGPQRIALPYAAVTSDRLHQHVTHVLRRPACALLQGTAVTQVQAAHVELADGTQVTADLVLDARGAAGMAVAGRTGWQKFVGLHVQTGRPHGIAWPILMDATVPQRDDLCFVYVLPWSADRLLVEDTRFSNVAALDVADQRAGCLAWLAARGHADCSLQGEEQGVLPMPCQPLALPDGGGPIPIGMAGGWMHPATGYSLPMAVQLAQWMAQRTAPEVRTQIGAVRLELAGRQKFACLLNDLLFSATEPARRWHAMARFHRLPPALLARFYAMQLTSADQLRIFRWPPPDGVDLLQAARCVARTLKTARAN